MEIQDFKTSIIKASAGYMLTQKHTPEDLGQLVLAGELFLAVNDSPDNWREITQEQADALMAEQQAWLEAQHRDDSEPNPKELKK